MRNFMAVFLILFTALASFGQPNIGISGTVEWDSMRINAQISMDLASAGLRLPAGRTQGESFLKAGFLNLIIPNLLALQADSSSTIADLIDRGEFSLQELEAIAMRANSVAPSLSPDMRSISSAHSISLANISSALISHNRPAPVIRTLNPVSAARYTGIIIIAAEHLPVHGMRSTALAVPCLFPKIWDSEMNLIYERRMLDTAQQTAMVKYSSLENILMNNPSGLSPEIRQVVGDRPLRIFARGVFGIKSTDLIIERSDALLIISSEENRRLLSQGRVAIILDDSVLRYEF
jgi:hypothetical protein